ncbi:hypothetical protein V6N11_063282 [Hibiscus sabdariffa]|uniref:Uncharacterized protein n=1 Tax=Hibiscus sabdariffa TaxID=183260 RepID=A0ABR2NGK8_9ROSI
MVAVTLQHSGAQNRKKCRKDKAERYFAAHMAFPAEFVPHHDQPIGGNVGALARPRAIRDHLTLILDDLNPGIVAPEIQASHFELKLVMFNMLNSIGQFGGSPHEDARHHIRTFLEVCDSFRQQGVHEDSHGQTFAVAF